MGAVCGHGRGSFPVFAFSRPTLVCSLKLPLFTEGTHCVIIIGIIILRRERERERGGGREGKHEREGELETENHGMITNKLITLAHHTVHYCK